MLRVIVLHQRLGVTAKNKRGLKISQKNNKSIQHLKI